MTSKPFFDWCVAEALSVNLSSDPSYETIRTTFDLADGNARFAIFCDGAGISCMIVYFPGFRQVGIWVREDLRGVGRGTSLLLNVLERIDKYPVFSVIDASNKASLALFRKCGFQVLNTRGANRDQLALVLNDRPSSIGKVVDECRQWACREDRLSFCERQLKDVFLDRKGSFGGRSSHNLLILRDRRGGVA